jgi:hypothetical protein
MASKADFAGFSLSSMEGLSLTLVRKVRSQVFDHMVDYCFHAIHIRFKIWLLVVVRTLEVEKQPIHLALFQVIAVSRVCKAVSHVSDFFQFAVYLVGNYSQLAGKVDAIFERLRTYPSTARRWTAS